MQKEKEAINKEGTAMEMEGNRGKEETLPPGFRFHPTDEELVTCYLINKISDSSFTGRAITDVDLNKCEPWELPGKAKMGEKEWYFFSVRDRKYPTGVRTNRATNTGYWKTTGKDKEILNSVTADFVGMKKTLVFYKGRAPRGEKTSWVMHEYRIHSKSTFRTTNKQDEWVVCRVFKKSGAVVVKRYPSSNNHTRALNPYTWEIGPATGIVSPPMMMQLGGDPNFLYGRNNCSSMSMNSADHLSEVARVLRSATSAVNLPMQSSPFNFTSGGGAGAGGFTISGLNLNLREGGGGGGGANTTQPILRPTQPQPPPPPSAAQTMGQVVQDPNSNMMTAGSFGAGNNVGYGTEMSNTNPHSSRYLGMDHCVDLDNCWPNSY